MSPREPRTDPEIRIISLIASATEIVHALGLGAQMVGRSHECDHPSSIFELPVVSSPRVNPDASSLEIHESVQDRVHNGLSMYHVDVDLIAKLEPDLIITQDHCSVCAVSLADVERALCAVTKKQTRVCTLHPNTWSDVLRDIQRVADAAGVSTRADTVIRQMEQRLHNLERVVTEHLAGASGPRVALLEWLEPPMLAGCWMPELARRAGCVPVQTTEGAAFEVIDWETLHALDPDVVVMSPCGYTVEKTLSELEGASLAEPLRALRAVREGRAFVADGNALFSRPGPRLVETAYLLANAAHPDCALDLSKEIRALLVPWG